jgi:hypothetical protein
MIVSAGSSRRIAFWKIALLLAVNGPLKTNTSCEG